MLRNYIKVILRSLYKNRVYALINIIGLGMALSICIVGYYNYRFDKEFNQSLMREKPVFKINITRPMQAREQEYGITPNSLARSLAEDFTGLDRVARVQRSYSPVKSGNVIYNKQISYVDPEFLDIFNIPLVSGNKNALEDLGKALISQNLASVLFGSDDPIGKSFILFNDDGEEETFMVAGVFEDLPMNSSFWIDVLCNFNHFLKLWDINDTDWKSWTTATFVQFNSVSDTAGFMSHLNSYREVQNLAREDFPISGFRMVPMKDVGDNSREIWSSGLYPGLHPAARVAPPIMAILIFLLASFNFTNTSIAASSRRLMEIGVRKVVGGQRSQIVFQFITENIIVAFFAMILGVAIAKFLVSAYGSLWEYMSLNLDLTGDIKIWFFLVGLLLFTGIFAGSYPAFYISRFRPVTILYEKIKLGGNNFISRLLLTLQFTIAALSIISGFIFIRNANFQEELDLGYDKDMVVAVPTINVDNYEELKNEVVKNPDIISVGGTEEHIGWGTYVRPLKNEEYEYEVNMMDIGEGYIETMGLNLIEGRAFTTDRAEFDRANGSIIINQKMKNDFGWTNATNQRLTMNDTITLTVIGVVEDFYTQGLWEEINPTAMTLSNNQFTRLLVARAEADNLIQVNDYLKRTWESLFPNNPYEGFLQEETLEEAKSINSSIRKVYLFLAAVALILSLIGLYTMVSLAMINRTKEIGIRKVMGAGIQKLILILSSSFMIILSIACIAGCLAGFYSSEMVLSSIWKNYTPITVDLFVITILLLFACSILSIVGKVYKAAAANPADSLRYE